VFVAVGSCQDQRPILENPTLVTRRKRKGGASKSEKTQGEGGISSNWRIYKTYHSKLKGEPGTAEKKNRKKGLTQNRRERNKALTQERANQDEEGQGVRSVSIIVKKANGRKRRPRTEIEMKDIWRGIRSQLATSKLGLPSY